VPKLLEAVGETVAEDDSERLCVAVRLVDGVMDAVMLAVGDGLGA
jgi:hypothetical protein